MSDITPRRAAIAALAVIALGLGACTQPHPGPTQAEIFAGSVLRERTSRNAQ